MDNQRLLAMRAANYAALSEEDRRDRARRAAWHCLCYATARRMVRTGQYEQDAPLSIVVEDSFAPEEPEEAIAA